MLIHPSASSGRRGILRAGTLSCVSLNSCTQPSWCACAETFLSWNECCNKGNTVRWESHKQLGKQPKDSGCEARQLVWMPASLRMANINELLDRIIKIQCIFHLLAEVPGTWKHWKLNLCLHLRPKHPTQLLWGMFQKDLLGAIQKVSGTWGYS